MQTPSEGAAFVFWLLPPSEGDRLYWELEPYFDDYRFFPQLVSEWQRPEVGDVVFRNVGWLRERLESYQPSEELRRMEESLGAWLPLQESLLNLLAETWEDGWPYQKFPEGWNDRARDTLGRLTSLLSEEVACHFPQRSNSDLRELMAQVELALEDPAKLTGRQVGKARQMLLDAQKRWGMFGSQERASKLARRDSGRPVLEDAREVLLARLAPLSPWQGLENLSEILAPLPSGQSLPKTLQEKARCCEIASVERLLDSGVLTSARELGQVARAWTASLWRGDLDPTRQLLGDMYLTAEERFEDLPWVRRVLELPDEDVMKQTARQMVSLCWSCFPAEAEPSELLAEILTLLRWSGEQAPDALALVKRAVRAAQGTLYERYYDLPTERILSLPDELPEPWVESELGEICHERAASRGMSEQISQGRLVEELRVLQGSGLWYLWELLSPELDARVASEKVFRVFQKLWRTSAESKNKRWQRHRKLAHLWQRLVFFLSLLEAEALEEELQRYHALAPDLTGLLMQLQERPTPTDTLIGWCL